MMRYGFMYGSRLNWWGFGLSWILQLLFWVAIIVLVAKLFKHDHSESHESSALEILKQRYAKGEISKKEFEDMKKDLTTD